MVAMKQEKIVARNGASTVHDVMSLAMDLTDVRSSVRDQGRYVPTGFVGYDQRAKGVALGKLSIIGSRAGEGYDVLSLDIARHAAAADVPMETLFSGNDLDEEESVLCDAAYALCERMPLYIKAGRSMDADCIAETCRGLKQTSGLKLVVVDGLPSIVDHVDDEPRVLEQFSKLARDLDVAVVLTDLATRGPLRKPGLGNLINGKAECRYADAILFVYRPEFKCACGGDANKAELMVLKHPWIQPCTFELRFQPEYSRFTNH